MHSNTVMGGIITGTVLHVALVVGIITGTRHEVALVVGVNHYHGCGPPGSVSGSGGQVLTRVPVTRWRY